MFEQKDLDSYSTLNVCPDLYILQTAVDNMSNIPRWFYIGIKNVDFISITIFWWSILKYLRNYHYLIEDKTPTRRLGEGKKTHKNGKKINELKRKRQSGDVALYQINSVQLSFLNCEFSFLNDKKKWFFEWHSFNKVHTKNPKFLMAMLTPETFFVW